MGRSSGSRAARWTSSGALKEELQRELEGGQCVYCRARASSNEPLTREHVIPRARGGRRKDFRIIVAACARCNRKRGSRELVPFLLERPRRISSFLDYLATRSPESVREVDPRIFAELYVAVAIVGECTRHGTEWRQARERLCAGRSLHRRRYAVRRAVREVSARMDGLRERGPVSSGPSCILPARPPDVLPLPLEEPLERLASRLLSLLALARHTPGETAAHELKRSLERISAANATEPEASPAAGADAEEMLRLDRWAPRQRRPRARVDRRSGDRRRRRYNPVPRGRAA